MYALRVYYEALTVGPSHNYYLGRADADITQWVAYFIAGTASPLDALVKPAKKATSKSSPSKPKK